MMDKNEEGRFVPDDTPLGEIAKALSLFSGASAAHYWREFGKVVDHVTQLEAEILGLQEYIGQREGK